MSRSQKLFLSAAALLGLVIAFSILASKVLKPNQATPVTNVFLPNSSTIKLPEGDTVAAWIWEYPTQLADKIDPLVNTASEENINTLYLYIDEYIDIYEMDDSDEKNRRLTNYTDAVRKIIGKANSKDIKIHALSGNPSYGYDSHSYLLPILLTHVYEFNKQNPDTQFEGIQFDIEFYEDPRFFGSTQEYTDYYLSLVNDLSQTSKDLNTQYNQNLQLGIVIPFWFDEGNEYFSTPILPKIITSLASHPNPYIVVMSYRNVIEGDGGVMDITENELKQAEGTQVKIIIAQELVENKEQKITHYGKSRDQIKKDLAKILQLGNSYPNFGGISIHELEAFTNTI